jgi:hypothetical protein
MMRAAVTTFLEAVAALALGLGVIFGVGWLIAGSLSALGWLWSFLAAPGVWLTMSLWVVVVSVIAGARRRRAGAALLSLSALAAGVVGCIALSIPLLVFAAEHPDSVTSIGMGWLVVLIGAGFFLAFYLATFPVVAIARAVLGADPAPDPA